MSRLRNFFLVVLPRSLHLRAEVPQHWPSLVAGKHGDKSADFFLKEYESLRKEIEETKQAVRDLERNVVVAIGVSWAWLFHEGSTVPRWAWFLPVLFAILGVLRALGITLFYGDAHIYLSSIEASFRTPSDPAGWEHSTAKSWTNVSTLAFWALLLFSTSGIAIYEMWTGPHLQSGNSAPQGSAGAISVPAQKPHSPEAAQATDRPITSP